VALGFCEAWEASAPREGGAPVGQRGVEKILGARKTAGEAIKTEGHPGVGHHVRRGRRHGCGGRHHRSRGVGGERDEPWRERVQDLDLPLALAAEGTPRGVDVGRARVVGGRGRGWRVEEMLRTGDEGAPLPIGEQPEVADAHEAAREHVEQEAPEEFVNVERHDLRVAPIGVVLPPKLDDTVDETHEARIGDRDTVRIPTEVLEHLRGPTKRRLRIDDPGRRPELRDKCGELARVGERCRAGGEGQPALVERALQPREILRAEDDRERLHRKQKRRAPADPTRAVARQGAARDETVDVQMLRQRLTPSVEDGGHADRAAQVSRIAPEREQRVSGCTKEQGVDDARIALSERIERMGQREDHMKVRNRQEVRTAGLDPPGTRPGLARGTVAIATGVVRDPRGATVVTRLPMPAQEGGAACRDRAQRQRLDRREPVRAAVRVAVGAHEVREGEAEGRDRGRRRCDDGTHGLFRWPVESIEQIEWRARSDLRVPRQLEIPGRGAEMAVAHQALNRVQIHAGFEQMRRE
jgi:hypothetical protein